jgi:hypothetical protein
MQCSHFETMILTSHQANQRNGIYVSSLQIIMTTCRILSQLTRHHGMAHFAPPLAVISLKLNGDSP